MEAMSKSYPALEFEYVWPEDLTLGDYVYKPENPSVRVSMYRITGLSVKGIHKDQRRQHEDGFRGSNRYYTTVTVKVATGEEFDLLAHRQVLALRGTDGLPTERGLKVTLDNAPVEDSNA